MKKKSPGNLLGWIRRHRVPQPKLVLVNCPGGKQGSVLKMLVECYIYKKVLSELGFKVSPIKSCYCVKSLCRKNELF